MKVLTPEEASEILKVTPVAMKKWLRQGKVKGFKAGNMWRIREEKLLEYIKEQEEKIEKDRRRG